MRVYRVFPYLSTAAEDQPGGAFFLSSGGKNRADSPIGAYRCLYVGDSVEGSIAETFGRFDTWDAALIEANPAVPTLPKSRFALATYEMPDTLKIRNLDDARALLDERLRPSEVVTRDRSVTQAWSANIHSKSRYAGVGWWSYYDSRWQSVALWDIGSLTLVDGLSPLRVGDTAVRDAAKTIARRLIV